MARRLRVLVIDDEIGMCKTLNDILVERGYRVEVAYSGKEGLAKAARRSPDLVILDIRLPDSDGVKLLEQLRQVAPESRALVITAYGGREIAEELRGRDILAYLEKPFELERALELIQGALNPDEVAGEAELLIAFGKRLRGLRRERRLTQEGLSRKTGLNQSYISDLERGKRNISLKNLYRLARALKVELEELFRLD
ncbi:MAG: response regulator [Candidatus Bipolaricaulia bacterium]